MWRSTVLILPLKLVFPAGAILQLQIANVNAALYHINGIKTFLPRVTKFFFMLKSVNLDPTPKKLDPFIHSYERNQLGSHNKTFYSRNYFLTAVS
jgi:hypothetical protein